MTAKPVEIHIFGRALCVNCPVEQEVALKEAAEELNNRLLELKTRSGVSNPDQLMSIVALNICYELMEERQKKGAFSEDFEQRLIVLQHTLESALEQTKVRLPQSETKESDIGFDHNVIFGNEVAFD